MRRTNASMNTPPLKKLEELFCSEDKEQQKIHEEDTKKKKTKQSLQAEKSICIQTEEVVIYRHKMEEKTKIKEIIRAKMTLVNLIQIYRTLISYTKKLQKSSAELIKHKILKESNEMKTGLDDSEIIRGKNEP